MNAGTKTAYVYSHYTELTQGDSLIRYYSPSPFVGDIDGDGKKDLVIGSGQYESFVYYYKNIGTNIAPRFAAPEKLKSNATPITDNGYSTAWFVDWNEDGFIDMLGGYTGNYEGTADGWTDCKLYLSSKTAVAGIDVKPQKSGMTIAKKSMLQYEIFLNAIPRLPVQVTVINLQGKIIAAANQVSKNTKEGCVVTITLPPALPAGVYLFQIKDTAGIRVAGITTLY